MTAIDFDALLALLDGDANCDATARNAAAAIRALRNHSAECDRSITFLRECVESRVNEIATLRAALAESERDAGRYRFIRDDAQWLNSVPQAIVWRVNGDIQEVCSEDELDEAIDAAMAAQEKANG